MSRVGLRLATLIVVVAIGLTLVAVDHTGLHLVALSYGGGKQEVASGFLLCCFLDG